jgi:hypothetical protein
MILIGKLIYQPVKPYSLPDSGTVKVNIFTLYMISNKIANDAVSVITGEIKMC